MNTKHQENMPLQPRGEGDDMAMKAATSHQLLSESEESAAVDAQPSAT